MSNLEAWDSFSKPPKSALKQIKGGRLSGMTDINPQWRYEAMTRKFGQIGVGWRYEVSSVEKYAASDGQVCIFVDVLLQTMQNGEWSFPIFGTGGSMLIVSEKSGLRFNDEAKKMATTDALSVAMKQLGVGAEIYLGNWDGSKYKCEDDDVKITAEQSECLLQLMLQSETDGEKFLQFFSIEKLGDLKATQYERAAKMLTAKMEKNNAKR